MKITKKTTKKGEITVELDGQEIYPKYNYYHSRRLTGTTGEGRSSGVFSRWSSVEFFFGERKKCFEFNKNLDFVKMSAAEIAEELSVRIEIVSAWVNSFSDTEEVATIDIKDTLEQAQAKNALFVRTKSGEFVEI